MSKNIIVTGATGKQGGALIDQLTNNPSFTLIAITRNATGAGAEKLKSKGSNIKVVQADQNDCPALFAAAKSAASGPIWGVYSVQIAQGHGPASGSGDEVQQGCAMVDEAVKAGVKHFVYSSVERGGDEHSWESPVTSVPHFATKHNVEQHLKKNAGSMGWTILRPVAFFENLAPGFPAKVFMAAMQSTIGEKRVQWVSTKDIGFFAALAFKESQEWNHKAMGLAGDSLNVKELCDKVRDTTSTNIYPTFWFLGGVLKYMVAEIGHMITWFGAEGYRADVEACKRLHPEMMDLEMWLKRESTFPRK
ncbi:NmrA-like family domain-containing protein 1 [Fulvia fulva]|uniref:NmrA-like family domain-containing protein 1 n=1 Tax=Passalora fulva TaxID=5499 RepID=A0A9Q8PLX8_PASFU|nr:NmrA-like family domain-containing protein 1 [Fulvia fulva]KAK4608978.1 NmrA-like family domain-containing protein 1 [Fulvia fulva]KAK4609869.1 NmrA-like family domain-containing protein 1 [Fulvia fulva]UJO24845.1 NmrA-like family domain-containing protein 1 [Fulvia fulva]WPV22595.1 NmrA-like family domain-containing protein 1 [Fulvia fulva]WPV37720.1 NmrA-like family domain-containing protein 1 [Fulvia fulva]